MKHHLKIIKAVLLALLLTQYACEQNLSVNPVDQGTDGAQVTILKRIPQNNLHKEYFAQKWIDSNGGYILVGDHASGYSYIKFPQGALGTFNNVNGLNLASESMGAVNIQMYWESENLLQADFYPEGLQFNTPVFIHLSYKDADLSGINENALAIYYYNPSTDQWEKISDNINTQEDYVEGYINHFSRYAIGVE